jgi:hypothetical protein
MDDSRVEIEAAGLRNMVIYTSHRKNSRDEKEAG